jgi:hypothetical protein
MLPFLSQEMKNKSENNNDSCEPTITLRPLTMKDMKIARSQVSSSHPSFKLRFYNSTQDSFHTNNAVKHQVAASFAAEGAVMNELKQWNDLYGEGGSRKKEQLTYFL